MSSITQRVSGSAAAPRWPHSPPAESGKVCLEGSLFLFEKRQKSLSLQSLVQIVTSEDLTPMAGQPKHRAVPSLPVSTPCALGEVSVCSGDATGNVGADHPVPHSRGGYSNERPLTSHLEATGGELHGHAAYFPGNVISRVCAQLPTPEFLGSGKLTLHNPYGQ